ncbi:MAG: hypothetical protein HOP27_10860 [Anaerolineales bacterium]|nr:hypothetical protein [Anaerolineales bacterium]
MTIEQWTIVGIISGIATAILTLLGVITSLYMSIKAIREVQTDRRLNQAPYLAFEPGGQQHPIQFNEIKNPEQRKRIGVNGENSTLVGLKTDDGKITHQYHGLKNYGLGPAIHTQITWIPQIVWVGTESFRIDEKKLSEQKYRRDLNTIPASPSHLLPEQEATFFRIPAFIQRDYERKITRVTGYIEISYLDLFKERHTTRQKFHVFTGYTDNPPYIHFTFSDILFDQEVPQNDDDES